MEGQTTRTLDDLKNSLHTFSAEIERLTGLKGENSISEDEGLRLGRLILEKERVKVELAKLEK